MRITVIGTMLVNDSRVVETILNNADEFAIRQSAMENNASINAVALCFEFAMSLKPGESAVIADSYSQLYFVIRES